LSDGFFRLSPSNSFLQQILVRFLPLREQNRRLVKPSFFYVFQIRRLLPRSNQPIQRQQTAQNGQSPGQTSGIVLSVFPRPLAGQQLSFHLLRVFVPSGRILTAAFFQNPSQLFGQSLSSRCFQGHPQPVEIRPDAFFSPILLRRGISSGAALSSVFFSRCLKSAAKIDQLQFSFHRQNQIMGF